MTGASHAASVGTTGSAPPRGRVLARVPLLRGLIARPAAPPATPITPSVFGKVSPRELIAVGALIALATTVYAIYALRVGSFQNDEEIYLQSVRYMVKHFPEVLWHNAVPSRKTMVFGRGIQRLDLFILAVPFSFLRGPAVFQVARVIQCLLFASAALPVYLTARRARLTRSAGMFAAVLVLAIPGAVVTTSFLEECVAYPAFAWVIYTTWMATCEPSTRRDVLALLALCVAALSRTALLALTPVLPLAIVWHESRWGLAGMPLAGRTRALPTRLWSRHRLLCVIVLAAAAILIANRAGLLGGVKSLTGSYGLPHLEAFSRVLSRYRTYLSRVVAATGYAAVVVALPWTLGTLIRPRDSASHTTAAVCVLGVGGMLLSLLAAGTDERYVVYGAIPVALALASALTSWLRAGGLKLATVIGLLVSALATAVLIDSVSWPSLASPYDYFTFPAAIFFNKVLLGHLSTIHIPLIHPGPQLLAEALIVIATGAWAAAARAKRTALAGTIVLAVALVGLGGAQLGYTLTKFTDGPGEAGGPSAAQRSWVDRHVPGSASVGMFGISLGGSANFLPIWRVLDFWNTSIDSSVYLVGTAGDVGLPFPLASEPVAMVLALDSGRLSAIRVAEPRKRIGVPEYLLVARQETRSLGLADSVVGQYPALPVELLRLKRPARAEWQLTGIDEEGFLAPAQPAVATVFPGALASTPTPCASFSLVAPPGFLGHWPYTVRTGGGRVAARGTLIEKQAVMITVALAGAHASGGPAHLTVVVRGFVTVNNRQLSATLTAFRVVPCPAGPRA